MEIPMRNALMAFVAILVLVGIATSADPTRVRFDTHDGYFVSNKFEPDAPTSFVVINDQKAFDAVFGAAFVMRDKSHRLPPDAFNTKIVVAAIHRGKAVWRYKTEGVEAQDGTLIVRYSTTSTPSETASFACPLIVSLDKGNYAVVQFMENDKAVKKVELGGATTQPAAVDPKTASLAEALEDWITLLEKDDAKAASTRWARDANAAAQMASEWKSVRTCNETLVYRKWLDNSSNQSTTRLVPGGARQIGDAVKFKVGGHSFGHLHVDWVKTEQGWRIAGVWLCD